MSDLYGQYPNPSDRGHQQPGYGGQSGYGAPARLDDVASTGVRVGAFVLDVVIVTVAVFLAAVPFMVLLAFTTPMDEAEMEMAGNGIGALVGLVVWFLYFVVPTALTGRTLGKKMLGTQVVRVDDGGVPGWGKAAGRQAILALLNFGCYIPQIVNLVLLSKEPQRRGWHDRAAGTRVVTTR